MATKSRNTGISKCTDGPADDTGQEYDENTIYLSNGGIMNGMIENSPQLWVNSSENTDSKRQTHNSIERKRKEKIKKWIVHIGALLPPFLHTTEKSSSTVETMERAAKYITELKEKYELLLLEKGDAIQAEEIRQLKKELEEVKTERDNYAQIIKSSGISLEPQWKMARLGRHSLPNGEVSDGQGHSPKCEESMKGKSKRKNLVSVQLETAKQHEKAAQGMGNMYSGMFGGNQNMMNSAFPNGSQVIMTPNGQVLMPMNPLTNGPNMMLDKSPNGLGLLQMAMQDAGITEISRQPSPDNTSSRDVSHSSNINTEHLMTSAPSIMDDPNHALQTLASVASNPQNAVLTSMPLRQPTPNKVTSAQSISPAVAQTDLTTSSNNVKNNQGCVNVAPVNMLSTTGQDTNMPNYGQVPGATNNSATITNTTTAVCSSAPPIMSAGQHSINQLPNQGGMMVNMPMNPGQINLLPNMNMGGMFMNQQGQIIMVNEQGVPVMAGMPNLLPQDLQQLQQQNTAFPKAGKKDKKPNKINPSQPQQNLVSNGGVPDQMNVTSVITSQGQMNILQPQQGTMNVMPPNQILQPNMMQTLPMQGQQQQMSLPGNQNVFQQTFPNQPLVQMPSNNTAGNQNSGIILPANQNGNLLTLNTIPSQPNQLPSALILPNGQVIPVVQNAQSLINNQPGVLSANGQVVANSAGIQMPIQQMGMQNTVIGNVSNMDLNNQMLLGAQNFPMPSQAQIQQSNMGILLPDQTNNPQPITTSAQMLNNSVIATSSTQSIMTPQIQNTGISVSGSLAYQKTVDSHAQMSTTDVSIVPRNSVQAGIRPLAPDPKVNPQSVNNFNPGFGAPGPPIGPNGSILLTLPIDGQPMSVLVDPVTMQVLGRIPPPPATTSAPGSITQSEATTTTTTTLPASKKSSGGKKAPRICPKPNNQPSKKAKIKSPPSTEAVPPTPESEQMLTECSQDTLPAVSEDNVLESGMSSEESAAMTDILAKAAESIFSANASPPVGFYNPANEDNPLHIDTSAGDTEEDTSASPKKCAKTNPQTTPKSQPESEGIGEALNMDSLLKSPNDALAMNLPTEEEFHQTAESCTTPPNKKSKVKSKTEIKDKEDTLDTPKIAKKSNKKKRKQESVSEVPPSLNTPTMPEPVFDIPAEITFSEAQLSDVLDQVEKLDSSFTETPTKKSTKKKSKSEDADLPSSKKRKKNSEKSKGTAKITVQSVPDVSQPVSQPAESRLSIYDFQDDSPPEVSPVRKGVLNTLNTPKSHIDSQKETKVTQSISDSFDVLDSVLSQTINIKPDNSKNISKLPHSKSKSSKKKKAKMETKQIVEPEMVQQPEKNMHSSPTIDQQTLIIEQSLDNLLQSQNIDLSQSNDLVPASFAKMIDPLDELTSITSMTQSKPASLPSTSSNSLQNSISNVHNSEISAQQSSKTPVQLHEKEEANKPPLIQNKPAMEPPPLTHQQPHRNDSVKHKTPPYQSPSQTQVSLPSKLSPAPHISMHPSPQHQSACQSQTTVPLSHLPTTHRTTSMLPPQDTFQAHKSPAHHSPAHNIMSPNTMGLRNNLEQTNQSIVSPPNVTMGSSSRDSTSNIRSNPDLNIISPPNVTMGTMNTNQEHNIVSPANVSMSSNRSLPESHQGFGPTNNMTRVPEPSPIFPPPELPCSNEPLFTSPIASIPKLSHIETTSPIKPPSRNSSGSNSDGPSQRPRNSIYSADNFVQSSPSRSSDGRQSQDNPHLGSCYGRSQPDNTTESFNFTSIGMNLTSNTQTNSLPDGMPMSSASTPFSFSLTSVSSIMSASSSANLPSSHGHHPLFYPPLNLQPSVPVNNSQDNSNAQQPTPSMNMLGVDLRNSDLRNSRPHSRHMSNGPPNQNTFNFGMMDMGECVSRESSIPPRLNLSGMDKNSHPEFRNNNSSSSKRIPDLTPSRSMTSGPMDHNPGSRTNVNNSASSYFPSSNFNQPPSSLTTPPLRHPPVQSNERSRLTHQPPYDPNFQPRGPALSSGSFGANRFDNSSNSVPRPSSSVHYDTSSNLNQNMRKSNSSQSHKQSKQSHQSSGSVTAPSHPMPPQNTSSQSTPLTHRDMTSAPAQPVRQKSQSRKQNSKKNKPQAFNPEMDTNLSHSIFDSNQGMPPYFSVPNLSPNPNRNLQGESFLHGNLFGGTPRPLSNAGPGPKNSDVGVSFNQLFNPSRPQNSLPGLNFQPGFGMNHVSASSAPQITSHSGNVAMAPHIMPNFNLSNIFPDVNNSQGDSLNISPIKFPHGNHMLSQHGMDPNSLQHHQNSALYHNRGHPGQQLHNAMAINSLLGHNPHSFDVRPMGQGINSGMGPPFHGPGHPGSFGIPPLNFALHDSH